MTTETTQPPVRLTPAPRPEVVRSARRSLALAVALSAAVVCNACGLLSHVETKHFDSRADAPTSGNLAFVLPSYVPADATDITVRVDTERPDAKMYDWRAGSTPPPSDCVPATGPGKPPPFDADSWPDEVSTASGWTCGPRPVQLRMVGDHVYAW